MARFIQWHLPLRALVCLELVEEDGSVLGQLRAPQTYPDRLRIDGIPALAAVRSANLLADRLCTDVVVIDRCGAWQHGLLRRALPPPPHRHRRANPRR